MAYCGRKRLSTFPARLITKIFLPLTQLRFRSGFFAERIKVASENIWKASLTPLPSCKQRMLWNASPTNRPRTLSRDGVVYFETRFAPLFHTQKGLTHQQIVAAVLKGLERGRKDFGISSGLIICAMRNMNVSLEMAELAVDFRERGVVGFDLAGEEGGYPPKKHIDAFHYIQRENFNITVHAGEGYGKESIWQAIQYCGAHRIGHGTRLIEDIAVANGKAVKLGDLAQYVLDKRIPLEICLLSNVHTGATPSLAEHPFRILYQEKFRVTLNTDNRLMSDTTMSREFEAAAETFGLTVDDFEKITVNAMKSAFLPYKERCDFIYSKIKPAYARIRGLIMAQ